MGEGMFFRILPSTARQSFQKPDFWLKMVAGPLNLVFIFTTQENNDK